MLSLREFPIWLQDLPVGDPDTYIDTPRERFLDGKITVKKLTVTHAG